MDIDVEVTKFFVDFYNDQKANGKTWIPDCKVSRYVMLREYRRLISYGQLIPIEYLPIEEKVALTTECREMKNIFYTNESLKINCKILHLINLINNNS